MEREIKKVLKITLFFPAFVPIQRTERRFKSSKYRFHLADELVEIE